MGGGGANVESSDIGPRTAGATFNDDDRIVASTTETNTSLSLQQCSSSLSAVRDGRRWVVGRR